MAIAEPERAERARQEVLEQAPWYRRIAWPVWMGAGLTAAWVAAIVLYLSVYRGSKGFWQLDLNEAGDFFAGATAPLAFLWLFVAVLLQMIELGLQREELRQSRQALQASASEQKALVEQTELSAATAASSLQVQIAAQAEERLHKLLDTAARTMGRLAEDWVVEATGPVPPGGTYPIFGPPADDPDEIFWRARNALPRFCGKVPQLMLDPNVELHTLIDPKILKDLVSRLKDIIEKAHRSEVGEVLMRIELLELDRVVKQMEEAEAFVERIYVDKAMGRRC